MGTKKNPPGIPLDTDDAELWDRVRRGVDPLAGRPAPEKTSPTKARIPSRPAREQSPVNRPADTSKSDLLPSEGLERRLSRRIASGRAEIHSTVDLHGMTQDKAYAALAGHIEGARARGEKRILVITGKGRGSSHDPDRPEAPGVLRRALPLWLESSELAPQVVAFEPARQHHGGSGAFYVQLRSKRRG